jgi:hypothetical protein
MRSVHCSDPQLFAVTLYLFPLAGCRKAAASTPSPLAVNTTAASVQAVPVNQPQAGGYVISQDYREKATERVLPPKGTFPIFKMTPELLKRYGIDMLPGPNPQRHGSRSFMPDTSFIARLSRRPPQEMGLLSSDGIA